MKNKLVIFILLFGFCVNAQHYRALLNVGLIASQVDGDRLDGYDKTGLHFGLSVENRIKEKWYYVIGLNYAQKGSRKIPNPDNPYDRFYILRLNYIEVPFLVGLQLKKKYLLELGMGLGYLINSKEDVDGTGFIDPIPPFKNYDFFYRSGVGYLLSDRFIIKFNHSYSIVPIRNHPGNQTWYFDRGQYNNYLILSLIYRI